MKAKLQQELAAKESIDKLIEQRDEAIEIARKVMETVMQIYGHAQFCDGCQSFEIADSCRIQMHGMDRINSLEKECLDTPSCDVPMPM